MSRSSPYITVICDACGCETEEPLTALARGSYDERHVEANLEASGWVVEEGGDFCCEDCAKEGATDGQ